MSEQTTFIDKSQPPEPPEPDAPAENAVILAPANDAVPAEVARQAGAINIGGNTVTKATEHLTDEQKTLVRWLFNYAKERDWDWNDLHRETGIDRTLAWRVWTDSYRYPEYVGKKKDGVRNPRANERIPLDGFCERINKFKSLAEARPELFSEGFVRTSIWNEIEFICNKAHARKKMGFIFGDSQIGKTTCLREYQRQHNHGQTHYIAMPPMANALSLTRHIARALHVNVVSSAYRLRENVLDAVDSDNLLIFDEMHRVFTNYRAANVPAVMDTIRELHDERQCGIVLCGTNVFRDGIRAEEYVKFMSQIVRRNLYPRQLPATPPRSDLDLISAHHGLEPATGKAEEILLHIAETGGFGVVCTRLADAKGVAEKAGEPLNWGHFVKAYNIIRKMALTAEEKKKEAA